MGRPSGTPCPLTSDGGPVGGPFCFPPNPPFEDPLGTLWGSPGGPWGPPWSLDRPVSTHWASSGSSSGPLHSLHGPLWVPAGAPFGGFLGPLLGPPGGLRGPRGLPTRKG